MRKIIILSLMLSLVLPWVGYSQSRSQIRKAGLESMTVYREDMETARTKPQIESYTVYDKRGNTIEEKEYDDAGKLVVWVTYTFDKDDNKTGETHLRPNGSIVKRYEYKYSEGFRTERIHYLPNGKIKTRKTYEYTRFPKEKGD